MRLIAEADLFAGALALAYNYCDLGGLRRAFGRLQEKGEGADGPDLPGVLQEDPQVLDPWADTLRRGAGLAVRLHADAVYGMVAMRNRLVSGQMLNACMEESRRGGYQQTLPQVLIERGVLTEAHDQAIAARQEELLPELLAKERALLGTIDLERDAEETVELKIAMLLGEIAAKISFLTRADLDAAIRAQRRVEQGLPPEEEKPVEAPPQQVEQQLPMPAAPGPQPAAPGAAAPESEDPIKGYELLEKLGAGAMGAVLRARKRATGEIVALKILKPDLASDREYVERFLREAKAVARLSHKNIIRAVQVGRSGDYYFFAMEFIEGETVSDLIKAKGRLPERFAITVVRCIASALAHAWQHRIVHRDIKPDNIMVARDGSVKLTDLGLARTAKQDSTLTITGVVMGSPAYISPEQATGEKNLDSRSDIYALGATLYHMLTGNVPYDGDTPLHVMLRHMNDPLPDVRKAVPQVSEATRQVIFRMMAKRPEGRFQSALQLEAVARQIEEALARGETPAIPPGMAVSPPAGKAAAKPAGAAGGKPGSGAAQRPAGQKKTASGKVAASSSASASGSGERKRKKKKKISKQKQKQKEIGERLRRAKGKRKRRF